MIHKVFKQSKSLWIVPTVSNLRCPVPASYHFVLIRARIHDNARYISYLRPSRYHIYTQQLGDDFRPGIFEIFRFCEFQTRDLQILNVVTSRCHPQTKHRQTYRPFFAYGLKLWLLVILSILFLKIALKYININSLNIYFQINWSGSCVQE